VVTVVRADLTAVVVLFGQTMAQPTYVLRAGADGVLATHAGNGTVVAAGQVVAHVGGAEVIAATDGVLTWLVPTGSRVPADLPVASVTYPGFAIMMSVPVEQAYRMYSVPTTGTTIVTGGPAGLTCDLMSVAPDPADQRLDGSAPVVGFVCLLPASAQVVAGLPAKVGVQTATVSDVLVLPVEAVAGVVDTGMVTRVTKAGRERVQVRLGITDGHRIEIVDGLVEGDQVLAYAPGLDGDR